MNDIIIIVPAYKPDCEIMRKFINELIGEFNNVVIVNDGSGSSYDDFFKSLEKKKITVLRHCVNLGKGRALKTALNYIHNNYPNMIGVITADCDGQHSVKDIKKCAEAVRKNPNSLVLGVRDFNQKDVPFKSRYGNKITRNIFKMFIGLKLTDTQTGLRGLSKKLVEKFIATNGERYEYETNMLIDCKINEINIKEVKITTIYINKNKTSHFNPVKDSIIIYKLFTKYILSSLSTFALDVLLFWLFANIFIGNTNSYILLATFIARIISSLYNYLLKRKTTFKKMKGIYLLKYLMVTVFLMLISGLTVYYTNILLPNISLVLIKIIIDVLLLAIYYFIKK